MTDSARKLLSVCLSAMVVCSMFATGLFVLSGTASAGNVASTSITCVSGCGTSAGNVGVDAAVTNNDVLDVTLRPGNTPGARDLSNSGTGATTSTEYEVQVTLNSYDPVVASGVGNVQGTWSETTSGGQRTITLNVQPVNVQWDTDADANALANPTTDSHWDGTQTAEEEYTMVSFAMIDQGPSDAEGSYIMTNSQSRAAISVDTTDNELEVDAAGPHYETDGTTVSSGWISAYFTADLVDRVFGVSDTSQYYTAFGSQRSNGPSVSSAGNDVEITWDDFHYSSGTSAVGADTTDPTASAGSDTTVDEGTSVSFDGTGSSDNNNIASYEWDWTDDGTYEGSGSTASHTYSDSGTYTATLRVTDENGNTDTDQRTVTVESTGGGSSADIEYTETGLNATDLTVGDTVTTSVTLTNTGDGSGDTYVSYRIDDDIEATEYVYLDGGAETTLRFNSTFDTAGEFDISVGVDRPVGTVTVSAAAQTTPPNAVAGANVTVDAGSTVAFDGTQSTADGNITSYEWDWTGDGSYDANGSTATHSYADPGTYTVTLRVTDDNGSTDTDSRTVTVEAVDSDTEGDNATTTATPAPTDTSSDSSTTASTESEDEELSAPAETGTATAEETTAGSGPLSPGFAVLAIVVALLARRRVG